MSSSFAGSSGFNRTGATGARFKIASVITPDVSPRNGTAPVDISYSTTPNEKRSVRASNSFPRTCSGDTYAMVPTVAPGLVNNSSGAAVGIDEAPLPCTIRATEGVNLHFETVFGGLRAVDL